MLPQLAGLPCGACNERVSGEFNARFCEGCGNPIHNACGAPVRPVSNDELLDAHKEPKCPRCGSNPNTEIATHVRSVWLGYRARAEHGAALPHLELAAYSRNQSRGQRWGLLAYFVLFCIGLVVAGGAWLRGDEGALGCLAYSAFPLVASGLVILYYRLQERYSLAKWDQITDEQEQARQEKEPPV